MTHPTRRMFFILTVAALAASPLLAHPGHGDAALPEWRLNDGKALTALYLKSDATRVWLVDGSGGTVVHLLTDLDTAGRAIVRRTAERLRMLNGDPAAVDAPLMMSDLPLPEPAAAKPFKSFKRVKTRWDEDYLYVESDGLPEHPMMIGIRSWQQHVPLPQPFTGQNAWRIPLKPVVAEKPISAKTSLYRGAIALAVNGVPIFNALNNRGEDAFLAGELDQWGGHCGRGDDYHYHAAPLHLQKIVGKDQPIGYALDGFPIYGLTNPDGSPPGPLDEFNGKFGPDGSYRYHASEKYPYINGGLRGVVRVSGDQIDPQPRDNPIRGALRPLRGATITDFGPFGQDGHQLTYEISGKKGYVRYSRKADGSYTFLFEDPQGQKREETYWRRDRAAAPLVEAVPPVAPSAVAPPTTAPASKPASAFKLSSPAVTDRGELPKEFTGDGDGASPPLEWANPPAGSKSFAVVMHHMPGPGDVKWYWVLYDIPGDVRRLAKNSQGVGTVGGNSVNRNAGYAPPHSKGPGRKTYVLTVYALSAPPQFGAAPGRVDRATLLEAIKDRTLGSAELTVTYDRTGVIEAAGAAPPPGGGEGPGGAIHLLPRAAEEKLNLTREQRDGVAALEKETQGKLKAILTPEQFKTLSESRPPRPD